MMMTMTTTMATTTTTTRARTCDDELSKACGLWLKVPTGRWARQDRQDDDKGSGRGGA